MVASETLERATRSGPRPGDDEDRGNVGTMGDVGRPIKIVIFAPHRKTAFGAANEK
jgi:hypothetical protein